MNELVNVENGQIAISKEFTKQYADFQKMQLEMDIKMKEVKATVKEAMEKYHIASFEDANIVITYRKPTTRTTIDSKKLKEELPDIYEEYSKVSNVASSISVEVKC